MIEQELITGMYREILTYLIIKYHDGQVEVSLAELMLTNENTQLEASALGTVSDKRIGLRVVPEEKAN